MEHENSFDPWGSPLAHLIALEERWIANRLLEAGIVTPLSGRGMTREKLDGFSKGIANLEVYDPTLNAYCLKCACPILQTGLELQGGENDAGYQHKILQAMEARKKEIDRALSSVSSDVITLTRLRDEKATKQLDAWLKTAKETPTTTLSIDDLVQLLPMAPQLNPRQGRITLLDAIESTTVNDLSLATVIDLIVYGAWMSFQEWKEFLLASVDRNYSGTPALLTREFYRFIVPVTFHTMPLAQIIVSFRPNATLHGKRKEKSFLKKAEKTIEDIKSRSLAVAIELKNLRAKMAALSLEANDSNGDDATAVKRALSILLGREITMGPLPYTRSPEFANFPIELNDNTHDAYYLKYRSDSSEEEIKALHGNLRIALNIATGRSIAPEIGPKPFNPEQLAVCLKEFRRTVTESENVPSPTFVTWLLLELTTFGYRKQLRNGQLFCVRLRSGGTVGSLANMLNDLSNRTKINRRVDYLLWSFNVTDHEAVLREYDKVNVPSVSLQVSPHIIRHHVDAGSAYNALIVSALDVAQVRAILNKVGVYVHCRKGNKAVEDILVGLGIEPPTGIVNVRPLDIRAWHSLLHSHLNDLKHQSIMM